VREAESRPCGTGRPPRLATRFTELVGMPPSVYRREAAGAMNGMAPCVAKQVTRPIRNREAPSEGDS